MCCLWGTRLGGHYTRTPALVQIVVRANLCGLSPIPMPSSPMPDSNVKDAPRNATATALGIFKKWDYEIGERSLCPGDTLRIYLLPFAVTMSRPLAVGFSFPLLPDIKIG